MLIDKYGFNISDLRLGRYKTAAEREAALYTLVQSVRSRLDPDDHDVLTDDALRMIFDGRKGTIRGAGNEVAHEASEFAMSLAVLAGDLTPTQLKTLGIIYRFTQKSEPSLYGP
jgi:hypothetical protein